MRHGKLALKSLMCLGLTLGLGLPTDPAQAAKADAAKGSAKAAAQDPAAVLAVVSGGVIIRRGETTLDASFGAALDPGDIVETGEGAQAAVLFESGQIIELGPGSRITIGSVPSHAGESPVLAQVPDAFSGSLGKFARSSSGGEGLSVLPDLRSGGAGGEPEPLTPRNTRIAAGAAGFSWAAVEDALEYRVHLTGPGGAKQSHNSSKTAWSSPEGAFQAGERWSWSVEAVTPDGSIRSEEAAFEVATPEQWAEIASLKSRLEPLMSSEEPSRRDAAAYLYGSYCRSAGFYGEAIAELEELVARHPERRELHEELGSLYQAVGRSDQAALEYRKALTPSP
jgi:hypothetical protein